MRSERWRLSHRATLSGRPLYGSLRSIGNTRQPNDTGDLRVWSSFPAAGGDAHPGLWFQPAGLLVVCRPPLQHRAGYNERSEYERLLGGSRRGSIRRVGCTACTVPGTACTVSWNGVHRFWNGVHRFQNGTSSTWSEDDPLAPFARVRITTWDIRWRTRSCWRACTSRVLIHASQSGLQSNLRSPP